MHPLIEGGVTIALAVIGLAVVSSLVSPKANTTGVIQAGASGFNNALGVAEAPVTGTSLNLSLGYPSSNSLSAAFGF
jgi:hypothetical protein